MLIISLYGFDGKPSQFNKDLCSLSKQMKTTTIAYRSVNVKNTKSSFTGVNMKTTTISCRSVNMRTPSIATRSAPYLSVGGGDGLVAPLAPDHAVVGESVVDQVLGGGGSQGEQGQARESLDK